MSDAKKPLRSTAWFGHPEGFCTAVGRRTRVSRPDRFDGRPVIGICNPYCELTPCNAHVREFAERGA